VKITIGLSLSLTGEYAPMGRQAELCDFICSSPTPTPAARFESAASDGEFALECHDGCE